MITRWSNFGWGDIDRTFDALVDFRRRMEQAFDEMDLERGLMPSLLRADGRRAQWPAVNLYDDGDAFRMLALVPGVGAEDFDVNLTNDVLTLTGERKVPVPENASVHRRERGAIRFSRSFTLPARVDPERTTASLKDGVLTITVQKAAESRPRRIEVKAS